MNNNEFEAKFNEVCKNINPFDVLAGKVHINEDSIFWTKHGTQGPMSLKTHYIETMDALHRDDEFKPLAIFKYGNRHNWKMIYKNPIHYDPNYTTNGYGRSDYLFYDCGLDNVEVSSMALYKKNVGDSCEYVFLDRYDDNLDRWLSFLPE